MYYRDFLNYRYYYLNLDVCDTGSIRSTDQSKLHALGIMYCTPIYLPFPLVTFLHSKDNNGLDEQAHEG